MKNERAQSNSLQPLQRLRLKAMRREFPVFSRIQTSTALGIFWFGINSASAIAQEAAETNVAQDLLKGATPVVIGSLIAILTAYLTQRYLHGLTIVREDRKHLREKVEKAYSLLMAVQVKADEIFACLVLMNRKGVLKSSEGEDPLIELMLIIKLWFPELRAEAEKYEEQVRVFHKSYRKYLLDNKDGFHYKMSDELFEQCNNLKNKMFEGTEKLTNRLVKIADSM